MADTSAPVRKLRDLGNVQRVKEEKPRQEFVQRVERSEAGSAERPENSKSGSERFAKGSMYRADVPLSSDKEQHLPRDGRNEVTQADVSVKPTVQMKGAAIDDAPTLGTEADTKGAVALALQPADFDSGNGFDGLRHNICSQISTQPVSQLNSIQLQGKSIDEINQIYYKAMQDLQKLGNLGEGATVDTLERAVGFIATELQYRRLAKKIYESKGEGDQGHRTQIQLLQTKKDKLNKILGRKKRQQKKL